MESSPWEAFWDQRSRAAVLGLGRSGLAAAELLLARGAQVRALEREVSAGVRAAWEPLAAAGAELISGEHPPKALDDCALLIRSPGVPADAPILAQARRRGIPIRSELELAAREVRTPILAITGTNGKSTTTAWCAHLLRRAGINAVAAGNIGHPLARAVLEEQEGTIFVVEVSSFQLEDSPEFHPRAATILNLTPDHLDRHGSFAVYSAVKWSIAAVQDPGDLLVLGPAIEVPAGLTIHARQLRCTLEGALPEEGYGLADGWIQRVAQGLPTALIKAADLALPGPHNLLNAMAATALATAIAVESTRLVPGLRDFPGLPHRLEQVGTLGGVRCINDSKSTNTDSLRVALASYSAPVVLIAGGRDKGGDFTGLAELARRQVRHLVAMGEAAEMIQASWPQVPTSRVEDLAEALERALAVAGRGDVVLLSPGCASFDMFRNFEERGDLFRALVAGRIERGGEEA